MTDSELVKLVLAAANDKSLQEKPSFLNIMYIFVNSVRRAKELPSCPMQELMKTPCEYWEESLQFLREDEALVEYFEYVSELPF